MSKSFTLNFGQAPQVTKGGVGVRPAAAKKAATSAKSSLPALDYDGPALTSEAAEILRARFAPKDNTKTVWL